MSVLVAAGFGFCICAVAALLTGRLPQYKVNGLFGIANSLHAIDAILDHSPAWGAFSAAVAALCFWRWWHGGGGDDTKRRLRKWRDAFTPVRRTAPVAS